MSSLPLANCLLAAIATPVGRDLRPDCSRLVSRGRQLLEMGCDGIALLGTTGEGIEFAVEDRMEALDAVIAAGMDPQKIIVSVSALPIPDIARLSQQATDHGVHGLLVMPPCVFREAITEEGTFEFFEAVIDRTNRPKLNLYLYHFPSISGVPITPRVIRRLDERYSGVIAGVKDSGGDSDYTEMLVRRFSHLSIFTGTEIHVPELLSTGLRGTICGLANVMPRLMRVMIDLPTAYDRRQYLPLVLAGDVILTRSSFIPSIKTVVAAILDDSEWRRVLPPLSQIPVVERDRLVTDFMHWDASLPSECRSIEQDGPTVLGKVVSMALVSG
jgi:4-hydroxy-tetrahydrodipicolinate synthase